MNESRGIHAESEIATTRDTLVIIPTYRHPECLPLAIASAQNQTVGDIDIVVVGDGVADDTRDAIAPILAGDDRVRFLDLPKAIRHGEEYRDAVIRGSAASVITYLGDDDLFFPHHIETMRECISGVDFANPLPVFINAQRRVYYIAGDLADPDSIAWHLDARRPRNSVSLTGATHTRESYLRLPHGWRPAPVGRWTDHYMWEQYFQLQGFTARTSRLATTAKFATVGREGMTGAERAMENQATAARMAQAGFRAEWDDLISEVIRVTAVRSLLRMSSLEDMRG